MQLSDMRLSGVVAPLQHTGIPTERFGSLVWGTGLASVMATLARNTKAICMIGIGGKFLEKMGETGSYAKMLSVEDKQRWNNFEETEGILCSFVIPLIDC